MPHRTLTVAILAASALVAGPGLSQDLREQAREGASLAPTEAAALERQLAENPQDLGARARLLGYHAARPRADQGRHTGHLLWFVRNLPESEVLDSPPATIIPVFNPDGYIEVKRAWQQLVRAESENVVILRHAAGFLMNSDQAAATALLHQAEALEPSNPEWARALGRLDWREARLFPEGRDPAAAGRAFADFERAYELSDRAGRVDLLPDLAMAAFAARDHARAREVAAAMLEAAPNRRNQGDSVHYGNLILGHLALIDGNLEEARSHLLAAGRTRGSPVRRAGAPDMSLAKALLERGEAETVLEYLDLCFDFWQEGRERLHDWIVLVEAGRIPDFGPRLMF